MGDPLIVVGSRVDALTLAFRVRLDPGFVRMLRGRAEVAKEHGRASVAWPMRAPVDDSGVVAKRRRWGELPLRWADELAMRGGEVETVVRNMGELRFSRAAKVWQITNEGYFRARIDLCAPGGGEGAPDRCAACDGLGGVAGARCGACDGVGGFDDPGWTVEIVWYAERLAAWGLRAVIAESHAMAAAWGDVKEARVRRVDLCADVAGWEVRAEDVRRLAKRPRARWTVDDAGAEAQAELPLDDPAAVSGGGQLARRRITGISVGRGGALMARMYDKRAEVERDARRREREEDGWRAAGWDGVAPVTRVEFQIRGQAVAEFGLRNPDCATEAIEVDGKPAGSRPCVSPDGEPQGLAERLDFLWRSCLAWVRLVVPEVARTGRPKPVNRLQDDPRWALLRSVRFSEVVEAAPIRRFRKRAAASSAQALGVTLSQAAREGRLVPMAEEREAYDPARAEALLRARVLALKVQEVERIMAWLLEREGDAVGALVHLGVRANASAARFARYRRAAEVPRDGPRSARARGPNVLSRAVA